MGLLNVGLDCLILELYYCRTFIQRVAFAIANLPTWARWLLNRKLLIEGSFPAMRLESVRFVYCRRFEQPNKVPHL